MSRALPTDFDARAEIWDDASKVKRAEEVAAAMRRAMPPHLPHLSGHLSTAVGPRSGTFTYSKVRPRALSFLPSRSDTRSRNCVATRADGRLARE
jgi:hypothetical protein